MRCVCVQFDRFGMLRYDGACNLDFRIVSYMRVCSGPGKERWRALSDRAGFAEMFLAYERFMTDAQRLIWARCSVVWVLVRLVSVGLRA